MRIPVLLSALLLALVRGPAAEAQAPLGAAAFEAHVAGRTLLYAQDGVPYGIEEYRPGREVLWSFLDGNCVLGRWFPAGDMICFEYDRPGPVDGPQCWRFTLGAGGLVAQFEGGPDITETGDADAPPICLDPDLLS